MSREALHSASGVELYTPADIADASRAALGGVIDLDPASCAFANKVIKAAKFYSAGGLDKPWNKSFHDPTQATVFLNPPGGTLDRETYEPMPFVPSKRDPKKLVPQNGGISAAAVWWQKLLLEYRAGNVSSAVYYCFRLDVLQTIQGKRFKGFEPPHVYPFCIFKKRPRHYSQEGRGTSPTHACAAFFLPPLSDHRVAEGPSLRAALVRFDRAFAPLGAVRL